MLDEKFIAKIERLSDEALRQLMVDVIPEILRRREAARLASAGRVIRVDLGQVLERAADEIKDGALLRQWLAQHGGEAILVDVEVAETPEVMNAEEAARLLRVSGRTARDLCRQGKLPCEKVGREWRIRRKELMRYLEGMKS